MFGYLISSLYIKHLKYILVCSTLWYIVGIVHVMDLNTSFDITSAIPHHIYLI